MNSLQQLSGNDHISFTNFSSSHSNNLNVDLLDKKNNTHYNNTPLSLHMPSSLVRAQSCNAYPFLVYCRVYARTPVFENLNSINMPLGIIPEVSTYANTTMEEQIIQHFAIRQSQHNMEMQALEIRMHQRLYKQDDPQKKKEEEETTIKNEDVHSCENGTKSNIIGPLEQKIDHLKKENEQEKESESNVLPMNIDNNNNNIVVQNEKEKETVNEKEKDKEQENFLSLSNSRLNENGNANGNTNTNENKNKTENMDIKSSELYLPLPLLSRIETPESISSPIAIAPEYSELLLYNSSCSSSSSNGNNSNSNSNSLPSHYPSLYNNNNNNNNNANANTNNSNYNYNYNNMNNNNNNNNANYNNNYLNLQKQSSDTALLGCDKDEQLSIWLQIEEEKNQQERIETLHTQQEEQRKNDFTVHLGGVPLPKNTLTEKQQACIDRFMEKSKTYELEIAYGFLLRANWKLDNALKQYKRSKKDYEKMLKKKKEKSKRK